MAAEHTVKAFDEDITRLRGLIAEMGGLAEVSLSEAMDALGQRQHGIRQERDRARQADRFA